MNYSYWKQTAAPWVSASVLAGGFVSALILLWLVKFEAELRITITNY